MKEIEIKAHLKHPDKVIKHLEGLGCILSIPITQVDTVYSKIIGDVGQYLKNDHFVRIREKIFMNKIDEADQEAKEEKKKFIFTVKKPLSKSVLTKAEHETEITDPKEMEQALFLMGYKIANRVTKRRRTGHLGGFEICIDDVDKLGLFIEIEKMSDGDAHIVRGELNKFLASLDIETSDEIHKGYDIMAIERDQQISK